MINLEELIEIFKTTNLTRTEIEKIRHFGKMSYVYLLAGKFAEYKLLKINDRYLWPIFRRHYFLKPSSPIYQSAVSKKIVRAFVSTLREELKIRSSNRGDRVWRELMETLRQRTRLFPSLLAFDDSDFHFCQLQSQKLSERWQRLKKRHRNQAIMRGIKYGTGIVAGIGTLIYISGKIKGSKK